MGLPNTANICKNQRSDMISAEMHNAIPVNRKNSACILGKRPNDLFDLHPVDKLRTSSGVQLPAHTHHTQDQRLMGKHCGISLEAG